MHALRVGRHVDRVALLHGVAAADPHDDVGGRALDVAVALDEAVGAELLDDGHVDGQTTLAGRDEAPVHAGVQRRGEHGWREQEKNGVTLHHATYRPLKARYPALVSDLHIQARVKATEVVKSALALQKQGRRVSMPVSRA